MRRFAFIMTILGLFSLTLMLNFPAKEIASQEQLQKLEINKKVLITGKVTQERIIYQNTKLLTLENNISIICECPQTLKSTNISIQGIVSEYNNKKQVTLLRIV